MSRSWSVFSALLILSPFTAVGLTNTYNSNAVRLVCVGDNEEQPIVVLAKKENLSSSSTEERKAADATGDNRSKLPAPAPLLLAGAGIELATAS